MARDQTTAVALRSKTILRHVVPVAACALTAHVAAYGTLLPGDGTHGYFAWYAPAVALLSIAAVVGTVVALAAAFVSGPSSRMASAARTTLPPASPENSLVARVLALAFGGTAFLAAQETLERSLPAGRFDLVRFAPSSLALVVGAILLLATAVALVERAASRVSAAILGDRRPSRTPTPSRSEWFAASVRLPASSPLAVHGGLRAPPATV